MRAMRERREKRKKKKKKKKRERDSIIEWRKNETPIQNESAVLSYRGVAGIESPDPSQNRGCLAAISKKASNRPTYEIPEWAVWEEAGWEKECRRAKEIRQS